MKKLKLLLIFSILFVAYGNAQKGISFGLRITPMFNWVTPSDSDTLYSFENSGTNIGIGFGPSMKYSFSDNFNVDISGVFSWQKFSIIQTEDVLNPILIDVTEDFKIQYLRLPVNFNGQFSVVGDLQALINFGLGANIKLKSSRRITDNTGTVEYSSDYIKVSVLNFADIFLSAGIGAAYNFNDQLQLSLTAQYNNGILDGWFDNKNDSPSTIRDLTIKHKNVTFNIGFYINL